MRYIYLLLTFFLFGWNLQSQNLDPRIAPAKVPLSSVERVQMPTVDNEALLQEELARRAPGVAPRFAETFDVKMGPKSHGTWETLDNGNAVWRLRIASPAAHSINLGFSQFFMPPGGSLILYSEDQKKVLGPFTPADNEAHEQLWTPILDGDEIVIEVQVPQNKVKDVKLTLKSINHDYLGFSRMISGSCNLDVICGAADGWGIVDAYRDIIQSVAVIGLNGGTFCTGFLINNARNDCAPLFMTADHCGIGPGNAASLVAYWNFQNSTCRQPGSPASGGVGNGVLNDFNSGATFLAGYAPTDFTLVEFDDPISETSDGFFAGWTISEELPTDTIICVHHPSTDEKRISFEFDPVYLGEWGSGDAPISNGNHVIVADWDIGTTEGGSSGSPLFNNNKQVIGQLHGGLAACGNNAYDSYGWFSASWVGGGTPSTRLSDWLDPDGTGITEMDGRWLQQCSFFVGAEISNQSICAPESAVYAIEVGAGFTNEVTLAIAGLPDGITAAFSTNPATPGSVVNLTLNNTAGIPAGSYNMIVSGTDGIENAENEITLNLFTAVPDTPGLILPGDAASGVSTAPTFIWDEQINGTNYNIEVATDAGFTDVVGNQTGLSSSSTSGILLESSSTYYWRVRANNECGDSDWSPTFSFTTAEVSCAGFSSTDVPIIISSSGTPTIISTIDITTSGDVSDLRVLNLDIAHTWVGDLRVILTSPSGTEATLFDRPGEPASGFGCNGDNVFLSFDDLATNTSSDLENTCGAGIPAIEGTYQAVDPLSIFAGEPAEGTWSLSITDNADQDGGELLGWELDLCATTPNVVSITPETGIIEACIGTTVSFDAIIGNGFDETGVTLGASGNPAGTTVDFSTNPAPAGSNVTVTVDNITTDESFLLEISGTDGTNTATAKVLIVILTPPDLTNLIFPADQAVNVPTGFTASWDANPEATAYRFVLALDENFSQIVQEQTISTNSINLSDLQIETDYYWTVFAINDCGESTENEVFLFSTIADLSISINPSELTACQIDAATYEVNIGSGFESATTLAVSIAPDAPVNISFDPGAVQPGAAVNVVFSDLFNALPGSYTLTFTIDDGGNSMSSESTLNVVVAPDIPELVSPENGAILQGPQPILFWQDQINADEYFVEIATDDGFANVVESANTDATNYEINVVLDPGVIYYWRVTASNDCGGALSLSFSFSIETSSVRLLNDNELYITPNPSSGLFSLQLEKVLPQELLLQIINSKGQLVQISAIGAGLFQHQIDLSNYPSGVYLLKLQYQEATETQRIIVQK